MKAYRCGHSGKYLPPDYVKEWGRKYGIGLGRDPVSECVNTQYDEAPPKVDAKIRSLEQVMHPVTPTFAQVDLVEITEEEYNANRLYTRYEDPRGLKRARVLLEKQLENPRGKVALLRTQIPNMRGIA